VISRIAFCIRITQASQLLMNLLSNTWYSFTWSRRYACQLWLLQTVHHIFSNFWVADINFELVHQDWQHVSLVCVVGLAASFGAPFSSPSPLTFTSLITPRQMGSDRYSGPYSCPNCTKVYQHRPSLSQHLKHECGKEPQFQCPFCPQRTTQKGSLRKHIRRRHSFENHYQCFWK